MNIQPVVFVPPRRRAHAQAPVKAPQVKWESMEVILKVAERCNINCTYCYFFNLENDDYKDHPSYIHADTVENCGRFLAEAARSSNVREVQIDLHGGEPLMLKKERFDDMCSSLYAALSEIPVVRIVMQTNAMLIDDEWIEIFARHRIEIGISLDGPKEFHDRYRIDHQGRGTYDKTIEGLRRVQNAIWDQRLSAKGVGLICVIDPDQDARAVFDHFVDDLGLQSLHFLLPMYNHDNVPAGANEKMSKYLCDLFDAWTDRKDPAITIRYFNRLFGLLINGLPETQTSNDISQVHLAYTIASNGDVGAGDDLRNTFPELFHTGSNVANTTLHGFLADPTIAQHMDARQARHDDCKTCCWGRICDGGDLIGTEAFRYSGAAGFSNPSVYCESIKALMTHMTRFALSKGVSFEHISKSLVQA